MIQKGFRRSNFVNSGSRPRSALAQTAPRSALNSTCKYFAIRFCLVVAREACDGPTSRFAPGLAACVVSSAKHIKTHGILLWAFVYVCQVRKPVKQAYVCVSARPMFVFQSHFLHTFLHPDQSIYKHTSTYNNRWWQSSCFFLHHPYPLSHTRTDFCSKMISSALERQPPQPDEKSVSTGPVLVPNPPSLSEEQYDVNENLSPRDSGRAAWTSLIAVSVIAMATWGESL